jgi:Flp pilus assembly protein TadG
MRHASKRRLAVNRAGRSRVAAQAGSVSLEFAILLPVLFMVLIGIIDTSLLMYDKAALVTTARVTARQGTVISVPPLTTAQIAAFATTHAQGTLVGASTPSATATQSDGSNPGSQLTVQVSCTYKGLVLGSALSVLTGPVVLSASAVMVHE